MYFRTVHEYDKNIYVKTFVFCIKFYLLGSATRVAGHIVPYPGMSRVAASCRLDAGSAPSPLPPPAISKRGV